MQRYTVDLSDLFSDHRQKVFVGRRHQWKHIACLLEHIRCVFHLDSHIYLTNSENVLFPEREDLDVIQESDQLIVHPSNSLNGTQQISAPKGTADGESRVAVVNQNGKRKRDPLPKLKLAKSSQIVQESSSDSDSDDDDNEDNLLPKIFVELESMSRQDESVQELPKPKRKRIRKRKSKKVEVDTPPKVIVKTYGKSKVPAINTENETHTTHIRFDNANGEIKDKEIECDVLAKKEPYRNLNKIIVPRVIKAVSQPSVPLSLNDETPSVPDYEDVRDLNMADIVNKTQSKRQSRKRKKSLEIKQELIEANTERAVSPTWDTELDQAKETFLSTYSGEEFWVTLQDALENFPSIAIPSANDIIAYRIDAQSYLALVERADDGESDDRPALKLTMRQLNGARTAQPVMVSATLDQLTGIRLVATYQP
ncbi:uncharacterized protein LOC135709099 [Ochlerotatus camptorhynchus]|uniref:uncharacterized protein LOC135709099 n=1 Tax=Ochlerotatus camptorhynchus TaxID=644619 RepID=UPI0031DF558C